MPSARTTELADIDFLTWARQCAVPIAHVSGGPPWDDLRPLADMIGDARIVALSEALHGGNEPLEFRNRLIQYLVQTQGFTAVALESGIVEGRALYDYVRGGPGTLPSVLRQGVSWGFDQLAQNRELVSWLREYNADPRRSRPINFYGFDVPGSPGEPNAPRGIDTALLETLRFLDSVDRPAAIAFRSRLEKLLRNLRFDLSRPSDAPGYDRLSLAERDALTATLSDLLTLLERKEASYAAASTAHDYEWAHRAALGAYQVDAWLRSIPIDWQPSSGPIDGRSDHTHFLALARDVRDRAQADNLEWIVSQEGPKGKVLVFAHRYHLSKTPVHIDWRGPHQQHVMGTYLGRRFGNQLCTLCHVVDAGEVEYAGLRQVLRSPAPHTIEGLAGEVGTAPFLLDLRSAPAPVAHWLRQRHTLGQDSWAFEIDLGSAFDILLYLGPLTPALSSARQAKDRPPVRRQAR